MSVESQSWSFYVAIHDQHSRGTKINLEACPVCRYAKNMLFLSLDLKFSNLRCFHYGYITTVEHTAARNGVFNSVIKDYYFALLLTQARSTDANCDILPLQTQIYSQL
jgi:hypothetical protein